MTRSNFSPPPYEVELSVVTFLPQVVEENKRLSEKMTGLAEEVKKGFNSRYLTLISRWRGGGRRRLREARRG